MEESLKKALVHISDILTFLEKIKDKKLRPEKDTLIAKLKEFLKTTNQLMPQNQKPIRRSNSDEETYDDVATQPSENYNDLAVNQDKEAVYDENIDDDIYEDNMEPPADEDYNDVVVTSPVSKDSNSANLAVIVPTACEDLKDPSIADYLEQKNKGSWMGTWQKKWCVVQGNVLYIYDSPKDKKQKEAFALNGYMVSTRDDVTKEAKRKERCFELMSYNQNSKVYDFCAADKEGTVKWKRILEQASHMSSAVPKIAVQNLSPAHSEGEKKSKLNIFSGIKNKMKISKLSTSTTNIAQNDGDVYDDTAGDNGEVYQDTAEPGTIPIYDDNSDPDTYEDTARETHPVNASQGEECYEDFEPEPPKPPLPSSPSGRGLPSLPPTRPTKLNVDDGPGPPTLPKRDEDTGSGSGSLVPRLPPRYPSFGSGDKRQLPQRPSISSSPKHEIDDITFDEAEEDEKYKDVDINDLYQGMWDCMADDTNELSFKRGQIVHIISRDYDNAGWWIAKRDEEVGLVPKKYLMEAYAC